LHLGLGHYAATRAEQQHKHGKQNNVR
jgi:hypothetical protein